MHIVLIQAKGGCRQVGGVWGSSFGSRGFGVQGLGARGLGIESLGREVSKRTCRHPFHGAAALRKA